MHHLAERFLSVLDEEADQLLRDVRARDSVLHWENFILLVGQPSGSRLLLDSEEKTTLSWNV
jgi:hypothetical protein